MAKKSNFSSEEMALVHDIVVSSADDSSLYAVAEFHDNSDESSYTENGANTNGVDDEEDDVSVKDDEEESTSGGAAVLMNIKKRKASEADLPLLAGTRRIGEREIRKLYDDINAVMNRNASLVVEHDDRVAALKQKQLNVMRVVEMRAEISLPPGLLRAVPPEKEWLTIDAYIEASGIEQAYAAIKSKLERLAEVNPNVSEREAATANFPRIKTDVELWRRLIALARVVAYASAECMQKATEDNGVAENYMSDQDWRVVANALVVMFNYRLYQGQFLEKKWDGALRKNAEGVQQYFLIFPGQQLSEVTVDELADWLWMKIVKCIPNESATPEPPECVREMAEKLHGGTLATLYSLPNKSAAAVTEFFFSIGLYKKEVAPYILILRRVVAEEPPPCVQAN